MLNAAKDRFLQIAGAFTTFNPHLTLRCYWNDEEIVNIGATNPGWTKWRTCDPTSAHWYSAADFEDYIAAHVARDQDNDRTGRTVRDFISELRGLQGSGKQKIVLAENEAARTPLADFFARGPNAVARLLKACKDNTAAVKSEALGLLGDDHLRADCVKLGGAEESFRYKKHLGKTRNGLPYVLEAAFAYCPEREEPQIITGVNFSVAINNPFKRLGAFYDLSSVLADNYIEGIDPVVVVLHYVCPHVDFTDHGKSTLALPIEAGDCTIDLIETVAKEWKKQRRAEERRESAEFNRRHKLLKQMQRPDRPEPARPTGILAEIITEAADSIGVKVDNLVVLSPGKDPFTSFRRRHDAEVFAKLFDRFVPPGQKKHLRALFYRCVMTADTVKWPTSKPLINTYGNWVKFQKAAQAARWLGLVSFDRIIDARNDEAKIYVPELHLIRTGLKSGETCIIPEDVSDALPSFYLEGFRGRQTHRIIFYGEKTSLAEILEPIARQIGAEMVLVIGESSETRLYEAMKRANQDGRPAIVLYFADHDPSGFQMARSVARKVQAHHDFQYPDLDVKVDRVALTIDQVRDWKLPDKPLSPKEKRADNWQSILGVGQTEIDAAIELEPEKLCQAIFEAIAPFYDDTLDGRVREIEEAWHEKAAEK
ncbi:MAG: hypothetical protein JO249_12895, partial [Acidobacteria bacterium]|nr:hypothetical protein [Acidobacteriota bacterium]